MKFRNQFFFLSNFYPIDVYGYPSVEHAYQAAKTLDKQKRAEIRRARSAAEAKRLGRNNPVRPDWEEIKVEVMETLVQRKFENPELRAKLNKVEGDIVEENYWHDNFWGNCGCNRCTECTGENHLGVLLMRIRASTEIVPISVDQ